MNKFVSKEGKIVKNQSKIPEVLSENDSSSSSSSSSEEERRRRKRKRNKKKVRGFVIVIYGCVIIKPI